MLGLKASSMFNNDVTFGGSNKVLGKSADGNGREIGLRRSLRSEALSSWLAIGRGRDGSSTGNTA